MRNASPRPRSPSQTAGKRPKAGAWFYLLRQVELVVVELEEEEHQAGQAQHSQHRVLVDLLHQSRGCTTTPPHSSSAPLIFPTAQRPAVGLRGNAGGRRRTALRRHSGRSSCAQVDIAAPSSQPPRRAPRGTEGPPLPAPPPPAPRRPLRACAPAQALRRNAAPARPSSPRSLPAPPPSPGRPRGSEGSVLQVEVYASALSFIQ